ncbi:hypothetical protein [Nonomuraea sp. NPDC049158]|uniref:hypothetical protein n=1 Tax=Nonomuraea sp. NPDC049158 TaxID=3155649 RepID=UPI0033E40528
MGTEFDHTALDRQRTVVGVAALAMVAVPFALGTVAAIPAETRLPTPASLALVLGLTFSLAAATDAIGAPPMPRPAEKERLA